MKGLRIIRGYVQVRIMHKGRYYHRNFGPDSPLARELAEIHLSEKRKEVLMGSFGIKKEAPSLPFKEVASLFFDLWKKEIKPDGASAHNPKQMQGMGYFINNLIAYFKSRPFDTIKPVDVINWREKRVKEVLGTSVNREQAVLSSVFSLIERMVKTEAIPAIKLPLENPCKSVEKAPNRKRQRVLSVLELKALKAACLAAEDPDLWEICEMALKSLLRKKDLFRLEAGLIDTVQAKTSHPIQLPIQVLKPLQYANFRKRWEGVRKAARLVDCQFRDLRKTGANLLKMRNHSNKMISEFLGHTSTQTTEIYMVKDSEHLKPLAKDLEDILRGL